MCYNLQTIFARDGESNNTPVYSRPRVYLNMSRAKKGAACEGKVPAQQEDAAVNLFLIEQLRELLKEIQDEMIQELKEETNK